MKQSYIIAALVVSNLVLLGIIFWPNEDLGKQIGILEGENRILLESNAKLDSIISVRAILIDSMQRSTTERLNDTIYITKYYEKRYETIKNAGIDSTRAALKQALREYRPN